MKPTKDLFLNLHFVFNMQILLTIPDHEVFTMSKMPNLGQVLDKAFKASRSQMIREIAHDRKVFLSYQVWYLSMTPEQRELTAKNIKSTLPIEDIVEKGIPDRELVIEAVNRLRYAYNQQDTSSPTVLDN